MIDAAWIIGTALTGAAVTYLLCIGIEHLLEYLTRRVCVRILYLQWMDDR